MDGDHAFAADHGGAAGTETIDSGVTELDFRKGDVATRSAAYASRDCVRPLSLMVASGAQQANTASRRHKQRLLNDFATAGLRRRAGLHAIERKARSGGRCSGGMMVIRVSGGAIAVGGHARHVPHARCRWGAIAMTVAVARPPSPPMSMSSSGGARSTMSLYCAAVMSGSLQERDHAPDRRVFMAETRAGIDHLDAVPITQKYLRIDPFLRQVGRLRVQPGAGFLNRFGRVWRWPRTWPRTAGTLRISRPVATLMSLRAHMDRAIAQGLQRRMDELGVVIVCANVVKARVDERAGTQRENCQNHDDCDAVMLDVFFHDEFPFRTRCARPLRTAGRIRVDGPAVRNRR